MKSRILISLLTLTCSAFFAQVQSIADFLPGTYLEYHKPPPAIPYSEPSTVVMSNLTVTLHVCGMPLSGFYHTTRTLTLTKNRYASLSIDHSFISFNNSGDNESDYVEYGKWRTNGDTLIITFSRVEGAMLPNSRIKVCSPASEGKVPLIERLPLVPVRKYVFHMGQLKEMAKDSIEFDRVMVP